MSSQQRDFDDSLGAADTAAVEQAAAGFPGHDLALRRNADGMTWAVLTPRATTPALLHFTFVRIAPGFVLEIRDREGRRQFCGAASIEDALQVAQLASTDAMSIPGDRVAAALH